MQQESYPSRSPRARTIRSSCQEKDAHDGKNDDQCERGPVDARIDIMTIGYDRRALGEDPIHPEYNCKHEQREPENEINLSSRGPPAPRDGTMCSLRIHSLRTCVEQFQRSLAIGLV